MRPTHALGTVDFDGPLTLEALERSALPMAITVTDPRWAAVERAHSFVERCLAEQRPVYGTTAGIGPMAGSTGRRDANGHSDILQHLTAGQGPDMPLEVVRAGMLARVWSLSRGMSGISPPTVRALCAALETAFTPAVPTLGSVGASGDLVPLAHIAQSLRGIGHAYVDGERMPAERALATAGLEALSLTGRDALSLINGTSVTSAAAGLAVASVNRSHEVALALGALLTDLLGAEPAFLAPQLLNAFGHPETADCGRRLEYWLDGNVPSGDRPLQEPYSVRCLPQLLGAARSAIDWAEQAVRRDLNGVSDNPLFFVDDDLISHGGNFFGQPSAFAADMLSITATQIGNLVERQLDLLVDPQRNSGLPAMLSPRPGEQHAVQGVQLVSTAVVVSMRRSCVPASMQSVPTNLHVQDIVPFGTQAALTALQQAKSLRTLLGCLAVGLRQAAHLKPGGATSTLCAELIAALAEVVEPIETDRPLDDDVRAASDVLDRFVREQAPHLVDVDRKGAGDVGL